MKTRNSKIQINNAVIRRLSFYTAGVAVVFYLFAAIAWLVTVLGFSLGIL